MTLEANNLTQKLVDIAQDHSKLQDNLTALQAFSGIVPMQENNIPYSSPDIVDQRSKEVLVYSIYDYLSVVNGRSVECSDNIFILVCV